MTMNRLLIPSALNRTMYRPEARLQFRSDMVYEPCACVRLTSIAVRPNMSENESSTRDCFASEYTSAPFLNTQSVLSNCDFCARTEVELTVVKLPMLDHKPE